jgi:hypothetical protein
LPSCASCTIVVPAGGAVAGGIGVGAAVAGGTGVGVAAGWAQAARIMSRASATVTKVEYLICNLLFLCNLG